MRTQAALGLIKIHLSPRIPPFGPVRPSLPGVSLLRMYEALSIENIFIVPAVELVAILQGSGPGKRPTHVVLGSMPSASPLSDSVAI